MGKKKWLAERNQILQRVLELCEWHDECGGNIQEEPYKSDFRKICADAYARRFCGEEPGYYPEDRNPRYCVVDPVRPEICGSTIWNYALDAGFVAADMDPGSSRYELVKEVAEWWDAWVYAWDHQPRKRRVIHKLKRDQSGDHGS